MVLTGLTGSEKHRLLILYDGFQSEELTEAEEQEFNALREKVRIVPAYEIITEAEEGASYQQSQRRYQIESAFNQAFHQYAKQFPEVLELPNRYANKLRPYYLDRGCRLFAKYGWIIGERDCTTILSLDLWAEADKVQLIDLSRHARSQTHYGAARGERQPA
jgi:hypothetical protein